MPEERRLVTILFADVTGSTALGETLDPEDVRALMARFYAICKEVIATHGGTLEKFIGDAVMAVFGLPQAHGDDAQRALHAALELRDRINADATLADRLPVRVGVNTGEVVATRDSTAADFLITGDAVNVAARLQQAADPWSVLCSERTARAAGDAFTFGQPTELATKGKAQPVSALHVLGRAARAVKRIPLIGRDTELAHLELVARQAFTQRRPFLVSLMAPAGTGKTRLLEEFLERLPSLAPHANVAIAQCLPYGQRMTYWPLRAVLFRIVGIPEDAPPDTIRTTATAWGNDAGVEHAQRWADLLAATVGAGEAQVADRDTLFGAWRSLVETASRRRPLVLAFEDLHWSSDSLLDLVEFVMQPRGDSPVLIIALARPELLDRRPGWGGGRRNYVSLALEPLADTAVEELVEHLLGRPSSQIVARVVERAEGNPFYAGEIVRSILDRVHSLDDEPAVAHALGQLPDTVQATVLARLDLLQPAERRVLQLGAVLGRSFQTPGITALDSALAGQAAGLADHLVDRDLVRPAEGDRFMFRHILIREVAYQTLPRSERASLHAKAGEWLEGQAAGREDALAELVAYHYREAATLRSTLHQTAGDGKIRERAVHWLGRAASTAQAGAAFAEAGRHLRAAIELADRGDLAELYERLGEVQLGGDASVEAYETALKLCREAGRPPDQELRILAKLVTVFMRSQGSVASRPTDETMAQLRAEGHALMARARDQKAIAAFLIGDGFYPFWRLADATVGDITAAEASARRGFEIAEQLDDPKLRSVALDALSGCAQARGAWPEVIRLARRRMAFQTRLDLVERIDTHAMIAWGCVLGGDLDEADRISASGLALLQPGQVPTWALHLAAWRTYALTLRGKWDDALTIAAKALQLWVDTTRSSAGYSVRGFAAALDVARARRDEKGVEEFTQVIEEILHHFKAVRKDAPIVQRMEPYLHLDLDSLRQLVERFPFQHLGVEPYERTISLLTDRGTSASPQVTRRIAAFAAEFNYKVLEAQARRALGVASRDPDELRRAVALFQETGALPYEARARWEHALITGEDSEFAGAELILEQLGDVDQLERFAMARKKAPT